MSDNFENKENQTPVEPEIQPAEPVVPEVQQEAPAAGTNEPAAQNDPAAPVNGAYHYRTYDLKQRQMPQEEPQATFGAAEWQWQPAEQEAEKPKKKRR